MLSETLASGLEQYGIGPKVRALRLRKKLALAQLGAHTGLSPAMLSKIERGHLFPTLPTLLRIALVFGVGLDHFFTEQAERSSVAVVRRKDRLRLPDRPEKEPPSYLFESLDFPVSNRAMEVYLAEFPVGSVPSAPHRHPGSELVYLIEGRLIIEIEGRSIALETGDAACFDSGELHSYSRAGRSACRAVVAIAPQPARQ